MNEPYRPRFHFSPRTGWMNDPNGLIRVDGTYHLFFQHDPASTSHGPMHWGHATSTDLVRWEEQPVALHPNHLGTCFSGSAIETDDGDMKLFYTAHSQEPEGGDHQVQCLVHADRALSQFAFDASNPVLPNPGRAAFRDPKVIWHDPTNRWIMLVTEGQSVGIYASTDLKQWTFLSSFGETEGRHSDGPWECPDLVPMIAPTGQIVWVLIVGLNPGGYAPGSGTQYFIGDFDGYRFSNANPAETELWLDHGRDYYAAQTFFDRRGDGSPIAVAWAGNWLYAGKTPTGAFRGSFSLPRQLRLIETPAGLRVAASVPKGVSDQFEHFRLGQAPVVPRTGTYRLTGTISLQPGSVAQIALFGEAMPQLRFERAPDGLISLRLSRAPLEGLPGYAHDYQVALGALDKLDLEVFVDNGLVEIAAGGGQVWVTNLHFPADVAGRITTTQIMSVSEPALP